MSSKNSTLIQHLATLPYWQPENALTWFLTWVQPWITMFGIVDNAIVLLIFGVVPGKRLVSATRSSRTYYVVISAAELVVLVVGNLLRQSIPALSLLVFSFKTIQIE